jgi:catechol 2,3-dioxygenase-like lactoylglutathione lyase family enzyme
MLFLYLLLHFGAAPQTKPELDGIAHVAVRVGDVAVSREFYRKLGFEQAFEFTDAKGVTVSYVKVNDRQFIELYRRNAPEEPLGLMHFCFDTADMPGLAAAYESRGLKPTTPRKAKAGNLLFNILDPEGHLLEYTQYLPDSLHWNERGKHLAEGRISDHMIRASVQAKDMDALRTFYTTKLLCETRQGSGPVRLLLPGKFHEEVELDAVSADWKPRITFAVTDIDRAQEELRQRGLAPRSGAAASVAVTDPDGVMVVFATEPEAVGRPK